MPAGKVANSCKKTDHTISTAGKWLAKETKYKNARIMTDDLRIPFYAGRELYSNRTRDLLTFDNSHNNYVDMDRFAVAKQVDLVIIRLSKKETNLIPQFDHFVKIKEFYGKKRIVIIYRSPEFL